MKDILASLPRLNEKYSIFSRLAEDLCAGDSKFLFSAEDGITSKDMITRCGSEILEGYKPVFDAASIEKLRACGGKLIGKTNMDEFGFGSFGTNTSFGIPKNPFDLERSCGGAAGGSACAAAVIDGHISLGTATGGSVCCPASFCGVYGFVPTYGRVSRFGVVDGFNSADRIGMLSSDPANLAKFLPVISGKDTREPTSCAQPPLELKGRRIKTVAVPKESLEGVSKDVLSSFEASLTVLKGMGIEVSKIEMPSLKYAAPAHFVLGASESCTNLASFVGMRYGQQGGDLALKFDDYFTWFRTKYIGEETKRRILFGTYARTSGPRDRFYIKSLKVRNQTISSYKKVFAEHDAVLTPTMPFSAPRFDEISKMTPSEANSAAHLTLASDLAGMPSMSVPCGYDGKGMPIGMLLTTDHWAEDPLLTFAKEWNSAFKVRRPEVSL